MCHGAFPVVLASRDKRDSGTRAGSPGGCFCSVRVFFGKISVCTTRPLARPKGGGSGQRSSSIL